MPHASDLAGLRVLVVEDELLVAMNVEDALAAAGCEVIGPFTSVADANGALDRGARPDRAVLDVNVQGTLVFPLAERLMAMGVPLVLCSGYSDGQLPARFAGAPRVAKPYPDEALIAALARAAPTSARAAESET